jgi:hypothetical protein
MALTRADPAPARRCNVGAVPQVTFARAIQRHASAPPADVAGNTIGEALAAYFEQHPGVRSYVLDERGAVRKHVAVFIGDTLVTDRVGLADPVAADATISVFQALSGGAA